MASNGSSVNVSQPQILVFKGDSYEFWSIKMKTLFKSQDLWDFVENGYLEGSVDDARHKENVKKDSKALFIIQQAVDEAIFSRISAATTTKQAWSILKMEYQGSIKVITVKLQSLHRDFETLIMKNNESVQQYLARVSTIVSQMRSYGDKITDETVVAKVLRSLAPKFDHVVAAIEESKDLSIFSFDELMGSLQAHEVRINRTTIREEEHAFQIKVEQDLSGPRNKGRGRGGFRGRGRGRGSPIQCSYCKKNGHTEENCWSRGSPIQCSYCKKNGHTEENCWSKQGQARYAEETSEQEDYLFMAYVSPHEKEKDMWYLDSACSNHMTGDKSKFKELDESQKAQVRLGNNNQIQIEGKGTVVINIDNGKEKLLKNVFFAPSLAHNLISVGQLVEGGCSVLFDDDTCIVKKKDKVLLHVNMTANKMFPLDFGKDSNALMSGRVDETELWHLRYGHLNIKGLQLLSGKQMVTGLPQIISLEHVCEGCALGKQTRKSFPTGKSKRATNVLELVHADLCGPMRTDSLAGSKHFLLFIDDYSRMSWVYFLKLKSEAFVNFRKFKALVERQSGESLKVLRTDRGGEFLSNEFNSFCDDSGIKRELTAPYTPEQNGVAERKNRTVIEMARCMLKAKDLPDTFWAEAVAAAVYLLNISPTKAVWNQTPYEAWYGNKPGVSHLKFFGCICYALITSERHKLERKSQKYIFVGYCSQSKAYRLYDPIGGKIVVSRDVVFNEGLSWNWSEAANGQNSSLETGNEECQDEEQEAIPASPHATTPVRSTSSSETEESLLELQSRKHKSLNDIYSSIYALFVGDPASVEEAFENEV